APATVTIGTAGKAVDTVEQRVEFVAGEDQRKRRLLDLLNKHGSAPPIIVFVNQKKNVDLLGQALARTRHSVVTLHGGKTQEQREQSLAKLKSGAADILVATDVAGRGIDVKDVSLVVNFDMAKDIESYTHRIGRTGRAGKRGLAVTFLSHTEDRDVLYDLRKMIAASPLSKCPPELASHEAAQAPPSLLKAAAHNDHSTSSATSRPRATVVIGDYELGSQIGRGSFATVYRGINKRTNATVAIKSVVRSSLTRRLLENLETEINILRTIKHESIVELIDCLKSRNHIHLVMEYCSLGDLASYMRKRKEHPALRNEFGGLSMHIVRSFVSQLGSAMLFLRSRDVIHRDIKTQNILLQPPPTTAEGGYVLGESEARGEVPWIKVADFGFARNLPSTALAETLCGSPLFMAPEILHYEPYDAKADLWSIGAVIYEMMTGKPPFHASNHVELARVIERTNDNISFPDEKQVAGKDTPLLDSTLKDLVRKLLKMNPGVRMSFADFFAHPAL
ncbi:Serine/threonine-protein kinase, partial [Coemansia aciculifera]